MAPVQALAPNEFSEGQLNQMESIIEKKVSEVVRAILLESNNTKPKSQHVVSNKH
jgi:hypothetical protein